MAAIVGVSLFNVTLEPEIERTVVFHPTRHIIETPARYAIPFEDIQIQTEQLKFRAWYLNNPNTQRVILFFHGNATNMSYCAYAYLPLFNLPSNVMMIDYPGFGQSPGIESESRCYASALAAYDYLVTEKKINPDHITVVGYSLGGPIATYLAAHRRVHNLILVSTFTSIDAMSGRIIPGILKPLVWLNNKFETDLYIAQVECPVMIIHGDDDPVVPYRFGVELAESANSPNVFCPVPGADHSSVWTHFPKEQVLNFIR